MSQRTLAGIVALPLVLGLWLAALFVPVPYVTYAPGMTVDVLAADAGTARIEVAGAKTHPHTGSLLMTTVSVTPPGRDVNIFQVLRAWFDPDDAVYPYDVVYAPSETPEESAEQAAVQMSSSQDVAAAVALRSLGHTVTDVVSVQQVTKGMPADGKLKEGDRIVRVGTTEVKAAGEVAAAVDASPAGAPITLEVLREGKPVTVEITPKEQDGAQRIGIVVGQSYDFPVDISLNVNPSIGGPSAGLLFALGINDVLTPGSLTGGGTVAGTGTLSEDGTVGPIGGIQQKIAASREQEAGIFLVPAANCEEALGATPGDMRLVKVTNFTDALASVQSWGEDHDATLPTCERNPS